MSRSLPEILAEMREALTPVASSHVDPPIVLAVSASHVQRWADELALVASGPSYDAEQQWSVLLSGLLKEADEVPPRERAIAFLKVWANSFLLKGMQWDVPTTMGNALNQVVRILEADLVASGWQDRATLRQQIAALRDYWREQMMTNGSTGESFEGLLYALDAVLAQAPPPDTTPSRETDQK